MAFPTTIEQPKFNWLPGERPIGHAAHHNTMAILLKAIQEKIGIDGSANTSTIDYILSHHNHDSRYYTDTEIDSFLSTINGNISGLNSSKANDSDVVHKTGDEGVNGIKTFQKVVYSNWDNTSNGLGIAANGNNHVYYGWYINHARKAYVGFSDTGNTTFDVVNEMSNGDINLQTNGTGAVKVNGQTILTAGSISVGFGSITSTTYTKGLLTSFTADGVNFTLTYEKKRVKTITNGINTWTLTYTNGNLTGSVKS